MGTRLTSNDVTLLIRAYRGDVCGGQCDGCRLGEELDKRPAERNKRFLARVTARVLRLRAAARKAAQNAD